MVKKLLTIIIFASVFCAVWAGTGKDIEYTSGTHSSDIVLDNELADKVDSSKNALTISGGNFSGEKIITGKAKSGNSTSNTLLIKGGTIGVKEIVAGVSENGNAESNSTSVQNITSSSSIVGGASDKANATQNKLILDKATLNFNGDAANPNVVVGGGIGDTSTGISYGNTVAIQNNSTVDAAIISAGYSQGKGNVSYNTTIVDGESKINNTSTIGTMYGGYSKEGEVYNNTVFIKDSLGIDTNIYGGYSETGKTYKNEIVSTKAVISGDVYGGYSAGDQEVSGNTVTLGNQTSLTSSIVTGGWNNASGNVQNNSVKIDGATLSTSTNVYGGYATSGNSDNNNVDVDTSIVGSVYGGYSASGAANSNSVSISNLTTATNIAAGYAVNGDANGNNLSISNSTLGIPLYGGLGQTSSSNNTVSILNSSLSSSVYGGNTNSGSSDGNKVTITGGSVQNVYGGYTTSGSASNNTVELNSVAVNGNVYAGFTTGTGDTTSNTIILSGNTTISGTINAGDGSSSSGNSLLLKSYQGTLDAGTSFENITVEGLDSSVTFENTPVNANITLIGRPSTEEKTLVTTKSGSSVSLNNKNLGVYEYTLTEVPNGGTSAWNVQGGYKKELARPYSQIHAASLAAARMGDAVLRPIFDEALVPEEDISLFADIRYDNETYNIDRDFDLESVTAQIGNWVKLPNSAWGWFARYVHSQYAYDLADAEGSINTMSIGGFYLLPYSQTGRFEFIARGGYQYSKLDFSSIFSQGKRENVFAGASVGVVQDISLVQLIGKLNYLHLFGDNTHDELGQSIKFEDAQSLQGELGIRLNMGTIAKYFNPYISVGAIYEMLGDSNVKVDGYSAPESTLHGATGQAEIGLGYDNPHAILPIRTVVSVFGKTGKEQGWGANLRLAFSF